MIVRPTVVIAAGRCARMDADASRRCERQAPADVSLRDAQLRRLFDEPLTRPLGSMLSTVCNGQQLDDEVTLVQHTSKRERLMLPDSVPVESFGAPSRTTRVRPRLSAPDAPPRSSALFAGIVDGWERVPNKPSPVPAGRAWGKAAEWHHVWAMAAVLGVFAMVLAFALTLHLVPRGPHQPVTGPAAAAR